MSQNTYLYLLAAAVTIYAIRVLPLVLIKKEISSTFIRSFLYYVPYVTLSVMAFPAIITAAESPVSGAAALAASVITAWAGGNLFKVAFAACAAVFVTELFL